MKALLGDANTRYEGLQTVLDLSAVLRADEFLLKLDRMHLSYKNLRKWLEEGDFMVGEVTQLQDSLSHVTQQVLGLA